MPEISAALDREVKEEFEEDGELSTNKGEKKSTEMLWGEKKERQISMRYIIVSSKRSETVSSSKNIDNRHRNEV